jgi:hypothetical protein
VRAAAGQGRGRFRKRDEGLTMCARDSTVVKRPALL